jgi:hypothetical protein
MDKVVSLLILVGIITFGAWVTAATIAKGWPLVWMLMALFPLLTGFISLYDSIKGTGNAANGRSCRPSPDRTITSASLTTV